MSSRGDVSVIDETEKPYAAAWRVYRRVGWSLIAVVAGLPIVVFPAAALLYHWFGIKVPLGGAGDLWIAAFVVGIFWEGKWRCPRCGQKFFTGRVRKLRLPRSHCQNCHLPQWAESDPDKERIDDAESRHHKSPNPYPDGTVTDPSLVGVWCTDPGDTEGRQRYGDTTLEFRTDGSLIYTGHGATTDQISLLTYRVVAPGWIETDQPSLPHAERTGYTVVGRRLTLVLDGEVSNYVRVA